jgi:hypothetical protein
MGVKSRSGLSECHGCKTGFSFALGGREVTENATLQAYSYESESLDERLGEDNRPIRFD